MALQGTLDSFSLPDVLRLLAGTGKSGCLQVDGDRGEGNVWVEAGAIVAARSERALDGAPVGEVVFELLRFESGSFHFAADEKAPQADGEPCEVEAALSEATRLLSEWRELEAVVPSLDHHVTIAPELTVDQVTVDAGRWKTLVALARGLSVGELGDSLSQGELAVARTVSDLVELGVAVVAEPGSPAPEAPKRNASANSGRAAAATRRPRVRNGSKDKAARGVKANGQRDRRDRPDERDRHEREVVRAENPSGGYPARGGDSAGARASSPAAARSQGGAGDERRHGDSSAPANGNLPRRSRATGQRSSSGNGSGGQGRQVGGNGVGPGGRQGSSGLPPTMSNPSSSPFTNGATMPTGTSTPAHGLGALPQAQPVAQPVPQPTSVSAGLAGLPPFDNSEGSPGLGGGGSLDAGLLGPSSLPSDTGQVPVVAASSLPPDLSWAAEDDEAPLGGPGAPIGMASPPMGTPPAVPPAPPSASHQAAGGHHGVAEGARGGSTASALLNTGRSPLAAPSPFGGASTGPPASVGPIGDGETAAHVAVMSPDARHAVESIIGPSGGGSGVVPAAGATPEELNQRGALLGFLASVRPR